MNSSEHERTLVFDDEYVAPILKGEKTATVRYPPDDPLTVGEVRAEMPDGTPFATLMIERSATAAVIEVHNLLTIFQAEHNTDDVDELADNLNQHYDDGIRLGTLVQVYAFQVEEQL